MRVFDRAISQGEAVGYAGPEEEAYCAEFAESLGGGYSDGVNSGTSAVFVALRALEIEPFSEVIVAAITDPGPLMAVALSNCVPVIADTQRGSYNSGPEQIEACLSSRTAAILLPHIAGEPADAPTIATIAARKGIPLIEDCAQAHGAHIGGRPVGVYGVIATFSTMHNKHFNTGGQGGIVFTRDPKLYERIRRHADRGKPFGQGAGLTNVVASLNMNMDELHAAIGRVQLPGLTDAVAARRRIAASLTSAVDDATGGLVTGRPCLPSAEPSFWFLRLRVDGERLTVSKAEFVVAVMQEGIPLLTDPCIPHTFEWFRERRVFGSSGYPWMAPSYSGDGTREFLCPNAHAAIATHLQVSINERWTDCEVQDTVAAFAKVASALSLT